jgi:acetyl-CoA acetyltransferase
MCAAKNRAHALLNDNAAVRKAMSVDEILADRVVLGPLTRAMCGGIADGAAAAILVSPAFARKHGLSGPCIRASGVVSGDPEGTTEGKPGASATARAARAAFEQCGIAPEDVSLAEVHDPTSPQELFDLEDMGLAKRGGAIRLLEEGATTLGGRLPVNVSGGLTSRGHPVGATGVAQVAEITQQLRGRAGAAQVVNARIGLAQMAGGLLGHDSAVSVVHILSN